MERKRAAAARAKAEADQKAAEDARKEAENAAAKWKNLGKDAPIMDVLKEAGHDPHKVFEMMKTEALKAGTPEAQLAALQKANDARFEALAKELKAEREAREAVERRAHEEAELRGRQNEFVTTLKDPGITPLLEEYDPPQLWGIASSLYAKPDVVRAHAEALGVDLTSDEGGVSMIDVLSVMRATQAAHQAKVEQRRKQSAAPQASQVAPKQAPAARPTVNGAEERKAGTTIGNALATERGSAGDGFGDEVTPDGRASKKRLDRLIKKFGG